LRLNNRRWALDSYLRHETTQLTLLDPNRTAYVDFYERALLNHLVGAQNPADLQDQDLGLRHLRAERAAELQPRVAELLAPFTRAEVWDLAQVHKVPMAPVNTPLQTTQSDQLVRGSWEAPIGSSVCRSGSTTHWHCGTILAKKR